MEIGLKKEIISNLNQQINQKSDVLQEKLTRSGSNNSASIAYPTGQALCHSKNIRPTLVYDKSQ
jgi:hypothetical protein